MIGKGCSKQSGCFFLADSSNIPTDMHILQFFRSHALLVSRREPHRTRKMEDKIVYTSPAIDRINVDYCSSLGSQEHPYEGTGRGLQGTTSPMAPPRTISDKGTPSPGNPSPSIDLLQE